MVRFCFQRGHRVSLNWYSRNAQRQIYACRCLSRDGELQGYKGLPAYSRGCAAFAYAGGWSLKSPAQKTLNVEFPAS